METTIRFSGLGSQDTLPNPQQVFAVSGVVRIELIQSGTDILKRRSGVSKGQESVIEAEEVSQALDLSARRAKETSYSSVVPAGEAQRLGHIRHELLEGLHSAPVQQQRDLPHTVLSTRSHHAHDPRAHRA